MIVVVGKQLSSLILRHKSSAPVKKFSTCTETEIDSIPRVFDILLHKYNFPPDLATHVASNLGHLKNPEKPDSILSFFKESGFSNTQLVKIVKYRPRFLVGRLESSIRPKIKIFEDMGFCSDDITKIISNNPRILEASVENNIIPSLSLLKDLLGSNEEVAKVIRSSVRFLGGNFYNRLLPNIEFFKACGIPMERIRIVFGYYPNCLFTNPEAIRKCAEKAKEMGVDASSRTFIYAILAIGKMSYEAWEMKIQAFRYFGFSDSDILTMFRKAPLVFCVSVEKIKKVKELLLATGKFSKCSIVNFPKSFHSSIENRYIPRFRMLEILENRGLIESWPSLRAVSLFPDDMFFEKFISPYSNEL